MQSPTCTSFLTIYTFLILFTSLTVLAQTDTGGRNITIPTTTTTTTPTSTTQTPSSGNQSTATTTPTTENNNTTGNHTTGTTTSNNTTKNSTSSTPVKLTPIPDATGTAGNVPVPAATGGKPNGRFGPDDQYIAGFQKLAIPFFSSLFIMSSTVAVLTCGAMV